MKTQTPMDKIIFGGILVLLVFAPLAFGSVHVWAYSILEFGVFLLLALWFAGQAAASGSKALSWAKTPLNLMVGMFLLLVGLQLLPLPALVAALVSPHTYADQKQLFSILAKAADAPADGSAWIRLSYYFHATLVEWLKLGAYCGMFFLVVNTLKSKKQIDVLVVCLIFLGLFEAVYAIYQVAADTPRVWWWVSRVGKSRRASGTFIGANHFAAYMGMIVCLTFGFLISQKEKSTRLVSSIGGLRERIHGLIAMFSPESAHPKRIFFFFAAVVMGLAVFMSGSRGGILSLAGSLLTAAVLFLTKRHYRRYGWIAIAFFLVTFIYGVHVGIEPTLKRFEQTQGLDDRLHITRSMFPIIADYPWSGVGFGNFRYLYPRYIDDYDRVSSSGYGHNDWVEAGAETGFLGLAVICGAFLIYLYRMTRLWKRRSDRHAVGIGAGVLAGLLAISFHSYFDFNLHIPANPLTLAALLGIGYAALHRQGHGYSQSFFYRKREIPLTLLRRLVIFGIVLFLSGFAVYQAGKHFLAEAVCPSEWNSTMNLNWNPALTDMDRAISLNPRNFQYHGKRARYFMSLEADTGTDRKAFNFEAQQSLEHALSLNPANGLLWYQLGYIYSFQKDHLYDYLNKWLPLADDCFEEALKCAPRDEYLLFNIGRYWVWRARLLSKSPATADDPAGKSRPLSSKQGIQKFQEHFQRLLAINPAKWKEAVRHTWEYFPSDAVVLGIVPDTYEGLKGEVLQFLAKMDPPEPLNAEPDTEPEKPPAEPAAKAGTFETVQAEPETAPKDPTAGPAAKTEVFETTAASPETAEKQYHTVRSGENLYRIGLRYGLTVDRLQQLNKMEEGATIYPGQKLVVNKDP